MRMLGVSNSGMGVGVGVGVDVGVAVGVDVGVGVGGESENAPQPASASHRNSSGERRNSCIGLASLYPSRELGLNSYVLSLGSRQDLPQFRLACMLLLLSKLRGWDDRSHWAVRNAIGTTVALLTPHHELVRRFPDCSLSTHELADTAVRTVRGDHEEFAGTALVGHV